MPPSGVFQLRHNRSQTAKGNEEVDPTDQHGDNQDDHADAHDEQDDHSRCAVHSRFQQNESGHRVNERSINTASMFCAEVSVTKAGWLVVWR